MITFHHASGGRHRQLRHRPDRAPCRAADPRAPSAHAYRATSPYIDRIEEVARHHPTRAWEVRGHGLRRAAPRVPAVPVSADAPGSREWPGHAEAAQFLLTLATGAVNAISFLALGGVFTSVMTANLALLGLALGNGHLSLANLAALAIAAYLVGAAAGSWIAARAGGALLTGVAGALLTESVVLWGVFALWLVLGGAPGTTARGVLLVAAAVSMGCQSGSVRIVAGSGATTAYITGALTGLVARATVERKLERHNALIILLLPVGAAVGGATVRWAHLLAPAIPAALVTSALVVTVVRGHPTAVTGSLPREGSDGSRGDA